MPGASAFWLKGKLQTTAKFKKGARQKSMGKSGEGGETQFPRDHLESSQEGGFFARDRVGRTEKPRLLDRGGARKGPQT